MSLKAKIEDFREAHTLYFQTALSEIEQECKQGHWMWFVFPQIYGLGKSSTARRYAICSFQEANAFLGDEVLGSNLRRICEALLKLQGSDAGQIFGGLDAMKLQSSMTLFDAVQPHSIFGEVLDKYYGGKRDKLTLCRLGLDDRMQKALEFIGVDAKDFKIVPQMYDFQRTEPTHRFSHTYRVMIGTALIAHKIKESRLGLLAFIAAFTHDLARQNDGYDPQHGRRAAQRKLPMFTHLLSNYKVTPQEYEMIAKAVTYHCETIREKLTDDCFKVCKMLSDADALDRCRFHNSEDCLNVKFLHFQESRRCIEPIDFICKESVRLNKIYYEIPFEEFIKVAQF
jgi:uncharacterized protein (DUF1810 family)